MLEFELTDDDLAVSRTATQDARKQSDRAIADERFALASTVFAVSLGPWIIVFTLVLDSGATAPSIAWLLVLPFLTWLFGRPWAERRIDRQYRQWIAQRFQGRDRRLQLWLDDHGLVMRSSNRLTRAAWAGLRRVDETPDHVVIVASPLSSQMIPKRIGAAAVSAFGQAVRGRLPAAPPAEPVLPPSAWDATDAVQFCPTGEEAELARSWSDEAGGILTVLTTKLRRQRLVFGLPFVGSAALVTAFLFWRHNQFVPGLAALTLLTGVVLARWVALAPASARRMSQNSAHAYVDIDADVLRDTRVWHAARGITVERPFTWEHYQWDAIATFAETPDLLVVKPWGETAFAIPRRAAPERVDGLAQALRQRVPVGLRPR